VHWSKEASSYFTPCWSTINVICYCRIRTMVEAIVR
jgi:hypothetical protein